MPRPWCSQGHGPPEAGSGRGPPQAEEPVEGRVAEGSARLAEHSSLLPRPTFPPDSSLPPLVGWDWSSKSRVTCPSFSPCSRRVENVRGRLARSLCSTGGGKRSWHRPAGPELDPRSGHGHEAPAPGAQGRPVLHAGARVLVHAAGARRSSLSSHVDHSNRDQYQRVTRCSRRPRNAFGPPSPPWRPAPPSRSDPGPPPPRSVRWPGATSPPPAAFSSVRARLLHDRAAGRPRLRAVRSQ